MVVLGIDPSYSRSGLCLMDESGVVVAHESVVVPSVVKVGSIYQFSVSFPAAVWHARECLSWVRSQLSGDDVLGGVFMEYPALSSRMGAWLLPLQCMMYTELGGSEFSGVPFYLIPPTSINSLVLPKKPKLRKGEVPAELWVKPTGKVAKRMIEDWVDSRYGVVCDHDVASGVVLAAIGLGLLGVDVGLDVSGIKFQLVDRWYADLLCEDV